MGVLGIQLCLKANTSLVRLEAFHRQVVQQRNKQALYTHLRSATPQQTVRYALCASTNLIRFNLPAETSAACANSNFLKGVQWAPDGSCCLTASDDNRWVDSGLMGLLLL